MYIKNKQLDDVPINWIIDPPLDADLAFQEEEEVLVKVGQRKYFVVVCYDVSEPKRLVKIAKVCLSFGERVQKSVFECHLSSSQLNRMIAKLRSIIEESTDLLRVYKIAGEPKVLTWGRIAQTEDEELIIV